MRHGLGPDLRMLGSTAGAMSVVAYPKPISCCGWNLARAKIHGVERKKKLPLSESGYSGYSLGMVLNTRKTAE